MIRGQSEFKEIREYIENFNPEEFTSAPDLDFSLSNDERLLAAKKIKGRIKRRKMMVESFSRVLQHKETIQTMVTQEQIDKLLNRFSS